MLECLLDSLASMPPLDVELVFIVIENAEAKSLEPVMAGFRSSINGSEAMYEVEPRLGIPFARNRAVELAFEEGCDLLAFVDDDQTVQKDWLARLISDLDSRELDIVGGPIRPHECPPDSPIMAKLVWRGMVQRIERVEARARARRKRGEDGQVTITTGNWLADLEFLRCNSLRFDESVALSGGSDTRFYRAAKRAGARTGWCPEAIAYENIPPSRLNFKYQFRRARDQAIASYWSKYESNKSAVLAHSVLFVPFKLGSAVAYTLLAPFNRGASLLGAVRALAFACGRVLAMLGKRSSHYERVHGA